MTRFLECTAYFSSLLHIDSFISGEEILLFTHFFLSPSRCLRSSLQELRSELLQVSMGLICTYQVGIPWASGYHNLRWTEVSSYLSPSPSHKSTFYSSPSGKKRNPRVFILLYLSSAPHHDSFHSLTVLPPPLRELRDIFFLAIIFGRK